MPYRVMIVEDDDSLRTLLARELGRWDFEPSFPDGFERVAEEAARLKPQLVVLDIGLPLFDGFHWCARIRELSRAPILMLSARDSSRDMVMGMGMGADDYLAKPFSMEVLVAKARALVRRSYDYARGDAETLEHQGLVLDLGTCTVRRGEAHEALSRNEFLILRTLMSSPGRAVSRDSLAAALWRDEVFVDDNTLSVNVNRLRARLSAVGRPDAIRTLKGTGYLLE
jgi:DNA-binding response OmpR family regulator